MTRTRVPLAFILSMFAVPSARAGIVTFTDLDAFLAAAGDVHEINFETFPNGSPSVGGTYLTPEFNYTDQGVTFSSPNDAPAIVGGDGYFILRVGGPSEQRNWIIMDFTTPAFAVGIVYPGGTELSVFDANGNLIGSAVDPGPGTERFLGFLSDQPITRAIADRGGSTEVIDSFLFTPVPEPGTALLLAVGAAALLRRGGVG